MRRTKYLMIAIVAVMTVGLIGLAMAATDDATQNLTLAVSEICVLDVTGNPGVITVVAPGTGGQTPANPSDNSTYAQYTSTVASGLTRNMTAQWGGADAAPAGTSLDLTAAPAGGTQGVTAGLITVSSSAQNIITGIGSCATGTSDTDGAQLTYTLMIDDVTALVAGDSQSVTITLTLAEDG